MEGFHSHLSPDREIDNFAQIANPPKDLIEVSMDEVKKSQENIKSRMTLASKPTYDACRAKEFALRHVRVTSAPSEILKEDNEVVSEPEEKIEDGEHGVEWGTLIHSLLQLAMENPQADLKRAFKAALDEDDPLSKYADLAETTVKKVMGSALWLRAQQSESRLLEVPFQVLKENITETGDMLPTIFRGTIDLIFKERAGWILVDYKTDIVREETFQRIVDKYGAQLQIYSEAWQECTGEPVVETGLYLVRLDKYVRVQR